MAGWLDECDAGWVAHCAIWEYAVGDGGWGGGFNGEDGGVAWRGGGDACGGGGENGGWWSGERR